MLHTELSYDPALPLLGIYPKELKTCPRKNLYVNVYNSAIQNNQKVETTQTSIKR